MRQRDLHNFNRQSSEQVSLCYNVNPSNSDKSGNPVHDLPSTLCLKLRKEAVGPSVISLNPSLQPFSNANPLDLSVLLAERENNTDYQKHLPVPLEIHHHHGYVADYSEDEKRYRLHRHPFLLLSKPVSQICTQYILGNRSTLQQLSYVCRINVSVFRP